MKIKSNPVIMVLPPTRSKHNTVLVSVGFSSLQVVTTLTDDDGPDISTLLYMYIVVYT